MDALPQALCHLRNDELVANVCWRTQRHDIARISMQPLLAERNDRVDTLALAGKMAIVRREKRRIIVQAIESRFRAGESFQGTHLIDAAGAEPGQSGCKWWLSLVPSEHCLVN